MSEGQDDQARVDLAERLLAITEDWERLTPDEIAALDAAAAALTAIPEPDYSDRLDPEAARESWAKLPARTRARLAAWREIDGDLSNFDPEGWTYMIANWPEVDDPTASGERSQLERKVIGTPGIELIPVSAELAAVLRADWSEPVQIKIVDGEMICRRVERAASDGC